jgi:polyhydroxyalkanoate synthesis regulator phasin
MSEQKQSTYDRNKKAVDKLATDMVKHGGMSSEAAARKAAEIARKQDSKQGR